MNGKKWTREDALADIARKGLRPFEVIPGKIYAANPRSCLFCQHAYRLVDPADGRPYMITCSEALKEDEIKNDEWVDVGMQGACASFEDEEGTDEN